MRIQTTTESSSHHTAPVSAFRGSVSPLASALFRNITWLSDPTSWFARRVESQIQTQRRNVERQATLMWEDYGVTISFAGGRLILSLLRHTAAGSVAGYLVEEVLDGQLPDLRFANRGWRIRR